MTTQNVQDQKKKELLALLLSKRQQGPKPAAIVRREVPLDGEGCRVAPASFAQQRLWFLEQMQPGSARYNMTTAVKLDGPLRADLLERALNALVARHESLRTVFRNQDGELQQVARPALRVTLERQAVRADARETTIAAVLDAQAGTPFDLTNGPLLRATLLELGADEHALVIAQHHIVSDGWSLGVLVGELATCYDALQRGANAALGEMPIQYIDFTLWQREWLDDQRLAAQQQYWRGQLEGAPPSLSMPTDFARPPVQRGYGGKVAFSVPPDVSQALGQLSQRTGGTMFMTLLSGLAVLFQRYSGQDDVCIGTAVANRGHEELGSLIGFFVNSLIMRVRLDDAKPFTDLLAQVKNTAMDAYGNQDLPFEQLVQELRPERDMSRAPLFQVAFGFDNTPRVERSLNGIQVSRLETNARSARFDLDFQMVDAGDQLHGAIEYDADLFKESTIRALAEHFVTLLASAVRDPAQPVGALRMRSVAEQARGTASFGHLTDYPRDTDLASLFEAQAAARPDAIAASDDEGRSTYAELNAQANRLAHHLRERGVAPGTFVGLCMTRKRRLLVAILAILKTGAAYAPLDANYPKARLRYMLENSGMQFVLGDDANAAVLPEGPWQGINLERLETRLGSYSDANLGLRIDAGAVSHIMYTSGSTGQPKGVLLPHRAVSRLVLNTNYLALRSSDKVAQVASVSFDAVTFEIWGALLNGAQLVFIARETILEPHALVQALRTEAVSVMLMTSALFNQVVNAVPDGFSSLRAALFGGEKANLDAVRRAIAHGAPEHLINVYGPTECGCFAACHVIASVPDNAVSIPIGLPMSNSTVYILDRQGQIVPTGVPGELCVAGDSLALGYHGREDLTQERFVTLDLDGKTERVYRTGDLARYLADGTLEFIGRVDEQVKIRGFRIEPGEIETQIKKHPDVHDAVVVPQPFNGEKQLVAYIVARPDYQPGSGDAEQVDGWHALYDDAYGDMGHQQDKLTNFSGWNSSYTGAAIPAPQMTQWADQSAARILALKPKRVLEIGCGVGLLLFRMLPSIDSYYGIDFSRGALDYISAHLGDDASRVKLRHCKAHEIGGLDESGFDTIVLNSIVQYFPNAAYLNEVIEAALKLLAPGGSIFLGDVRHLGLGRAFHTSISLARASAGLPLEELRNQIADSLAKEPELLIAPEQAFAWMDSLPGIARVEILPKRADDDNELTKFRYDAILHSSVETASAIEPDAWLDWDAERLSLEAIEERLVRDQPRALGLSHVPNAKLDADLRAVAALGGDSDCVTAGELRGQLAARSGLVPSFEAFEALAKRHGYRLLASWARSGEQGWYDLVLIRAGQDGAVRWRSPAPGRTQRHTNNPLRTLIHAHLVPQLKAPLVESLPEYMVPAAFVVLDAMPLTKNGKLDYRALPLPDAHERAEHAYVAPRDRWEQMVAQAWREVLGLERVGANDNFFDLGGHSLLATQVMSRLQKQLELAPGAGQSALGVRFLFEAPTVMGLAARVAAAMAELKLLTRTDAAEGDEIEEFVL